MPSARPVRTCVGCRERKPQDELLRVIRRSDGTLEVGRTLPGRGAWLCARPDGAPVGGCLDQAIRRRAFPRALRASVRDGAAEALRANIERDDEDTTTKT